MNNSVYYHTYQLKEERAYRIVIKYLRHSTDVNEIRQELFDLGHDFRNIVNAHHRITKEPLNLFFPDLEPAANNKDVYNITVLQNKIVLIEPPRFNKTNVVQCARCQQNGRTKTYCNKPFVCVKCGGLYNRKDCTKRKDTSSKCSLCGGSHPANYKGCEHYHSIIQGNHIYRTPPIQTSPLATNVHTRITPLPNSPQQQRRYADVTKSHDHKVENAVITLSSFLEEFKGLFT